MSAKDALRRQVLDRRDRVHGTIDPAPALAALRLVLATLPAGPVAGYLPIRSEIDPMPTLLAGGRSVVLPVVKVRDQPLAFRRWQPDAPLEPGLLGTRQPASGVEVIPRVVVVPLVAFDRDGARLGYGGGFYDRTLAALRKAGPVYAIGFAYAAQEEGRLPTDRHDMPLDAIVTEQETIRLRS